MVIKVEIGPEMEARLAAKAKAEGIAIEACAEKLLENAIAAETTSDGRLSPDELTRMLHAIAEGSGSLPQLPTSSFTRESFYEDRP